MHTLCHSVRTMITDGFFVFFLLKNTLGFCLSCFTGWLSFLTVIDQCHSTQCWECSVQTITSTHSLTFFADVCFVLLASATVGRRSTASLASSTSARWGCIQTTHSAGWSTNVIAWRNKISRRNKNNVQTRLSEVMLHIWQGFKFYTCWFPVDAGWLFTASTARNLSKLLVYCRLRPTQPPTLSGTGN